MSTFHEGTCYESANTYAACIEFHQDKLHRRSFHPSQLIEYPLEPNPDAGDDKNAPAQKLSIAFSTADVVVLGWRLGFFADKLQENDQAAVRALAQRFADAGHFASYCRCVKSVRQSNHKKKGENNRKCGNTYLAWAFVEAAHFACRQDERCQRFYDRKKQQANPVIATKSLACKLAKAAWHVMVANVPYDAARVFGPGKKSFRETGREPAKGSGHKSHQD